MIRVMFSKQNGHCICLSVCLVFICLFFLKCNILASYIIFCVIVKGQNTLSRDIFCVQFSCRYARQAESNILLLLNTGGPSMGQF